MDRATTLHSTWTLAVFAALYVLVRLPLLGAHGLWVDEAFSLGISTGHSLEHPAAGATPELGDYVEAREPVPAGTYAGYLSHDVVPGEMARVIRATALSDTNPPLYYLGLNAWIWLVGTSDEALRGFSALWGLLCLPFLAALARDCAGRNAVVPTLLLFTLAPLSAYYTTEGRMYSLVVFLVVAQVYLTRLLQESDRKVWLLLWGLVAIAGLLTHYFFAFVLAAIWLWFFVLPGPHRRWLIVAVAAAVGLLVLPWYIQVPALQQQWRVTSGWLELEPQGGTFARAASYLFAGQVSIRGTWQVPGLAFALDGLIYVALACLTLWTQRNWIFGQQRRLLWLWLAAPPLGVIGLGWAMHNYLAWNLRYALAAMPAAHLLVGASVSRLPRGMQSVFITLLCVTSAVGWFFAFGPPRMYQPWEAAARLISAETQPGDVVIVQSIPSGVSLFARYLASEESGVEVVSWVDRLGTRDPADLAALASGRRQLYFVRGHAIHASDALEQELRRRWQVSTVDHLGAIGVYRVVIEAPEPPSLR